MVVTHPGAAWTGERDAVLLITRVGEFTRFLTRAERAPGTISTYRWALGDFVDFLLSRRVRNLDELDRPTLGGVAGSAASLPLKTSQQFLKWAAAHDYCDPRLKDWLTSCSARAAAPQRKRPSPTTVDFAVSPAAP